MEIREKELFSTEEVTDLSTMFENKLNKQLERKCKYEAMIKLLEVKLKNAIEKNELEENSDVDIKDITAQITNNKILLQIVNDSIYKIKKIREERLAEE